MRTFYYHTYIIFLTPSCCRTYNKHVSPVTDTDSTDEGDIIGGLGKFSHGVFHLVHHHWPEEIESAGGFNVHNTESAEAHHKVCMRLASHRVRHLDTEYTFLQMQMYNRNQLVFDQLKNILASEERTVPVSTRSVIPGVRVPLQIRVGNDELNVSMGSDLASVHMQTSFIHPEVRIARGELLDLMCAKLGIPRSRESFQKLEELTWKFGQKLVMPSGTTYWSTDSRYVYNTSHRQKCRRDNFSLRGTSFVNVKEVDGTITSKKTAMCCQSVCFVEVSNIYAVLHDVKLPPDILSEIVVDSLTFVLVRWFDAHPSATERDSHFRPVCPGVFNINHCLWRYARLSRARSVLCSRDGARTKYFQKQSHIFGRTETLQNRTFDSECHAWYDLIKTSSIDSTVVMLREFDINTTIPTDTWLQTVVIP